MQLELREISGGSAKCASFILSFFDSVTFNIIMYYKYSVYVHVQYGYKLKVQISKHIDNI